MDRISPEVLQGKGLEEILDLVNPGFRDSLRPIVRTFLDDDPRGDSRTIDPGPEIVNLFEELLKVSSILKHPVFFSDLEAYRRSVSLLGQATKTIETLGVPDQGNSLAAASDFYKDRDWQSHFSNNRRLIWRAAHLLQKQGVRGIGTREASRRPVVMVLGAGACYDIPLENLAAQFRVVLVDIDEAQLRRAVGRLPGELRPYVSYQVRDLSGGLVLDLTQKAERILQDRSKKRVELLGEMARLLETANVMVPHLEGIEGADFLISSMLVGQISNYPIEFLLRSATEAERAEVGDEERLERAEQVFVEAARRFAGRVERAHSEALGDFVLRGPRRVVYYASESVYYEPRLEPVPQNFMSRWYREDAPKFLRSIFGEPRPQQAWDCNYKPTLKESHFLFHDGDQPLQGLQDVTTRLKKKNPALDVALSSEWLWSNISDTMEEYFLHNPNLCRTVQAVVWQNGR